jgi:NAD(P)H-flavin reductase
MKQEFFPCRVLKILDEAPLIKRYFIKYPDDVTMRFQAGQFIMINLPIESKYTNRSYSIASPPSEDQTLELLIVLKEDGLGTPFLFSNIVEGSIIQCSLPLGKFKLPETIDKPIYFICTGTGIAPFRSMIQHINNHRIPHQEMHLIFGTRTEQDLLYRQEFVSLGQSDSDFHYEPVLSRAQNSDWKGRKGYVHQVYEEAIKEGKLGYFYLCGWSAMLKEAREKLQALGIDKSLIKFEVYD